jgi:hypothetical protein
MRGANPERVVQNVPSNQTRSPGHFTVSQFLSPGYGAFSVSPSHVDGLKEYIRTQQEHHRKESFQDEFRRLLKKYEIDFDERYVWD